MMKSVADAAAADDENLDRRAYCAERE